MSVRRIIGIIALLLVALTGAEAATIEVARRDTGSPLVVIEGVLDLGDIESFRAKVASLPKATVALLSDGGSLLAGIRIGTLIRTKKFTTVVPDGARCASACAFAWLGGTRRFVGTDASVGFHAAYILKASGPAESGPGNAILGAYLSQLGLSERAILYITQQAPTSIHWMSMEEADEHGITVALLRAPHAAAPSDADGATVTEQPEGSREQHAIDFVRALIARWSGPNVDVLLALGDLYADDVLYYGKSIPRQTVLLRKRRFMERWPQRSYHVRPASLSATCAEATGMCRVKGVMDFDFRRPGTNDSARGARRFEYSVALAGARPQIASETGSGNSKPATAASPLKQVGRSFRQLFAQIAKLGPRSAALRPKTAIPR